MSRADFNQLCARYEAQLAKDPAAALAAARAALPAIPEADRVAPPTWIHKLVAGALPPEALTLVEGLRLFDLILDLEAREVVSDEEAERRWAALGRWAEALPQDPAYGVSALDWSGEAWEQPPHYLDLAWLKPDFRTLEADVALAVLRSPLCARLVSLNLSRGRWTADGLNNHDAYLDAEDVMYGFMSDVRWEHLRELPCAKTLERLYLRGTETRYFEFDYDVDNYRFKYKKPPFPALKHLDVACLTNTLAAHRVVVQELLRRNAMPALETLSLTNDFTTWIIEAIRDADGDDIWIHHDYACWEGLSGYELETLAKPPVQVKTVAFGSWLPMARRRLRMTMDRRARLKEAPDPNEALKHVTALSALKGDVDADVAWAEAKLPFRMVQRLDGPDGVLPV
ncbi:MAG: hypothetical protein H6741_00260 [Alphaproteobacteria bacterium]|nr:hypothetical protein [Alphaproteobacteria bacterium]MCB9791137.1 hypothetical protein [Alphaproteobacteria bacterium]